MNNFFVETYGCQMNKSDSISVIENLKKSGFNQINNPENADFIIINSCSVRKTAENRIWGRLGYLKNIKKKNNTTIVIMGCMSQRVGEEFLLSDYPVDIVVGTYHKEKIPDIIKNYDKGQKLSFLDQNNLLFGNSFPDNENPQKAFVTISHGCDNYCSYCIVPYLRGKEISRPSNEIITDIKRLVDLGVIQVTLLGQNVNSYGKDIGDINFSGLLKRISSETGIGWIKYLSSHPKDFTDELIEVISTENKVSRWLHLAVQSGSNKILRAMNRNYEIESYIDRINKLKKNIPDMNLTTDILVGFPGETEKDFMDTIELIKTVKFDDAYMYKYNIREGTYASDNMEDDVPEQLKLDRLDQIIRLQKAISTERKERRIGKKYRVIADKMSKKSSTELLGISSEDLMILFSGDKDDFNGVINLKCTGIKGNTLFGEKI